LSSFVSHCFVILLLIPILLLWYYCIKWLLSIDQFTVLHLFFSSLLLSWGTLFQIDHYMIADYLELSLLLPLSWNHQIQYGHRQEPSIICLRLNRSSRCRLSHCSWIGIGCTCSASKLFHLHYRYLLCGKPVVCFCYQGWNGILPIFLIFFLVLLLHANRNCFSLK